MGGKSTMDPAEIYQTGMMMQALPGDKYTQALGKMSKETYDLGADVRKGIMDDYASANAPNFDPNTLPQASLMNDILKQQYSNARSGMEAQYNQARDSVISDTARGGGMDQGLTDLALSRANAVSQMGAQNRMAQSQGLMDLVNSIRANALGFAGQGAGIQGMGAASGANMAAASNATSNAVQSNIAGAQLNVQRAMAGAQMGNQMSQQAKGKGK